MLKSCHVFTSESSVSVLSHIQPISRFLQSPFEEGALVFSFLNCSGSIDDLIQQFVSLVLHFDLILSSTNYIGVRSDQIGRVTAVAEATSCIVSASFAYASRSVIASSYVHLEAAYITAFS
jgi:hypothetical protein